MNVGNQFEEVLDYIEAHLTDVIEVETIAKLTGTSTFDFQRLFSYIVGTPLSEYIRQRRMTSAALDLLNSHESLTFFAEKYQYSSASTFNAAFRSVHGVPPSAVRSGNFEFQRYSRVHVTVVTYLEA